MPRKKVVFVIVEGPSDETALGVLLSRHFDKDTVYTHVMHCDITTEYDKDTRQKVGAADITKKIAEVVKRWADTYRLKPDHFERIIHIVDTDGAFVAEDYVVQSDVDAPFYTLEKILCPIRENIIERNSLKISEKQQGEETEISVEVTAESKVTKLDYPVTIKRRLPNGKGAIVTHNGKVIDSKLDDGCIIFDVVPGNTYLLVYDEGRMLLWTIFVVVGAILLILSAMRKRIGA